MPDLKIVKAESLREIADSIRTALNYQPSVSLTFPEDFKSKIAAIKGLGGAEILKRKLTSYVCGDEFYSPGQTLGRYAFAGSNLMTSVTLNRQATLPDYCFLDCTNLTSVVPYSWGGQTTYPQATGIGCFKNCTSLQSIQLDNSASSIGAEAFSGCTSLSSVSFVPESPSFLRTIGDSAFYNCSNLDSFRARSYYITSIGNYAFSGSGIRVVNINTESSSADIGIGAFQGCTRLTTIVFFGQSINIGAYAFEGCSALTTTSLSYGITSIGQYAFSGCTSLTNFSVPSGCSVIDDYAFYLCENLRQISFSTTGAQNTTVSPSISRLGLRAFANCSALLSVTLPASVTRIDAYCFANNTNMQYLRLLNPTPPVVGSRILNITSNNAGFKIYVPAGSLSAYSEASNWKIYANQIEEWVEP